MIPTASAPDFHGPADDLTPADHDGFVSSPEESDPWWLDLGFVALPGV